MVKTHILTTVVVIMFGLSAGVSANENNKSVSSAEQLTATARQAVKAVASELKKNLGKALTTGSPSDAVSVCKTIAPEIARKHSAQRKLTIRRTALRLRNPDNAPDEFERRALQTFIERLRAGEPANKLEHSEFVTMGDRKVFRYMKAIPTAEKPCLTCHGSNLDPKLVVTLKQLYPEDQATGFKSGDLRGAFSVIQHAD